MQTTSIKELEQELRRRELDDPLALVYTPHEFQIKAHSSPKQIILVLGGNRTGKSWYACADALLTALGRRTYRSMKEPPVTIWYIMPSMGMFTRVILPILRKLTPRNAIKPTAIGDIVTKKDPIMRFKNGSVIHFLSADMRQRRLQGAEVDRIYIDETPDEEVYEESLARVSRTNGQVCMVFSPIDAKTFWVRDKIYMPWMAGDRADIEVVMMPVADKNGKSLVPHFTDDDIKRLEQQWPDPAVRAARMYGEFITRTGLVFKTFERDIHVVKPFLIPKNYTRWWVVDPQYHRFAALFFAADDKGNYYVTDEYFSQEESLAYRCERMLVMTGKRSTAIPVYVDSANPTDMNELNWHFQRLQAPLGAAPIPIKKDVEKFVLRTHALLEPSDERKYTEITGKGEFSGAPRLMFFDSLTSSWRWAERDMRCSRLLWEMQRLAWDNSIGKPDKDSADGGDATDALIYGCSIIQLGLVSRPTETWEQDLSLSDVLLWRAIAKMDNAQAARSREW